jgi:hypothetical protein
MANKPAKRNITNSNAPAKKKNEGEIVMYVSMNKETMSSCGLCGKKTSKGILRQYKDELYCSKSCVTWVIQKDEINE